MTETTSQQTLVGFLHDLGIVVNFRDNPRLSETQVLDPEWVTNGIYKILNAKSLAKKEGELRLEDLPGVLDRKEYPGDHRAFLSPFSILGAGARSSTDPCSERARRDHSPAGGAAGSRPDHGVAMGGWLAPSLWPTGCLTVGDVRSLASGRSGPRAGRLPVVTPA